MKKGKEGLERQWQHLCLNMEKCKTRIKEWTEIETGTESAKWWSAPPTLIRGVELNFLKLKWKQIISLIWKRKKHICLKNKTKQQITKLRSKTYTCMNECAWIGDFSLIRTECGLLWHWTVNIVLCLCIVPFQKSLKECSDKGTLKDGSGSQGRKNSVSLYKINTVLILSWKPWAQFSASLLVWKRSAEGVVRAKPTCAWS